MSDDGLTALREQRESLVTTINFGQGQIGQWQNLIDGTRRQLVRFQAELEAVDAQLAKAAPPPGN